MSEVDERKQAAIDAIDHIVNETAFSRLAQLDALIEIADHCEMWQNALQEEQDSDDEALRERDKPDESDEP
jgi:hypothetical protein